MKILKLNYKVEYEDRAIAYTEAPNNIEDLIKQRRRWYRGMMQVLDKHKDMYFKRKYGLAGIVGVPNLWFDTISPIFNTALILLGILTALSGEILPSLNGLLSYFGLESVVGVFAISLDPKPRLRDYLVVPFLPFYGVFLDGIRVMSLSEEIADTRMEWEKPRRKDDTH